MKLEDNIASLLDRALSGGSVMEDIEDWTIFTWQSDMGRYIKLGANRHLEGHKNPAEFLFLVAEWSNLYEFEEFHWLYLDNKIPEKDESVLKNKLISFENYHRLCPKGKGTESLKQLESAFAILGERRNELVKIVFNPANQEDTKAWLEKNNYLIKGKYYYKDLNVPKR